MPIHDKLGENLENKIISKYSDSTKSVIPKKKKQKNYCICRVTDHILFIVDWSLFPNVSLILAYISSISELRKNQNPQTISGL